MQVVGQDVTDAETRQVIDAKYDSIASSEVYSEENVRRYKFLNYLPSPGYSLREGPTVSYNLGSIFRMMENRERNRVEKQRIYHKYKEKADEEYEQYQELKQKIEELEFEVQQQEQIIALERKLFAISEEKYRNNEITPTEYLQQEISFRKKVLQFEKKQHDLDELKARKGKFNEKVYYANN